MSKKNIVIYFVLLFSMVTGTQLTAQNRFKAGLVAGINVSQIRGDRTGGFNKFGLVGGVRAITVLKDKMDVSMELLFSQRGSRSNKDEQEIRGVFVNIDLNYIEVPVLFNFKDWYIEDGNFYRVQASGGFAYSRLINASASGVSNDHIDEVDNFNNSDISLVLGAEYFVSPKFSISARWGTSLNLLFDNEKYNPNKMGLRGHFLSFRTNYLF